MLAFLPAPLLGTIVFLLIVINTLFHSVLILVAAPFRFILPGQTLRNAMTRVLMAMADNWCTVNDRFVYAMLPAIYWEIEYPAQLKRQGWYLVSANHQSWVDILVLFYTFNGRIPFLKYFLKYELIWLPFMGLAMYALDFPFMKRHSKAALARRPELKGQDLETTRKACERFRHTPVSVINFLEGTRFTPAKHAAQQSPYQHLLKPKAGGIAFVLSSLGEQMHSMLDVTVVYPQGVPRFWDFACGRVHHIIVRIRERDIPAAYFVGDYEGDPVFRAEFQAWIGQVWEEKDALLAQYHQEKIA